MKDKLLAIMVILVVSLTSIAAGYGYVHNIVLLVRMSFANWTPELLARIAGVPLVPLGIIMGYIPL